MPPATPAEQLAGFIDRFDPEVAKLIRSVRVALRKKFPTAIELVYDHYNILAIGFCASESASDCIVSLAANSDGVALSFYYGVKLPDPHKLLLGGGKQNRFLWLCSAATLDVPEVQELLQAAVLQAKSPLPKDGSGTMIIKSTSSKQRSRR